MIEISLHVRCADAESDVGQRAQNLVEEASIRLWRALQAATPQDVVTITKSVMTVTQSVTMTTGATGTPTQRSALMTPQLPSQGPSLDEPGLDEPTLAELPSSSTADDLAFGDLTPQEHLIHTLKQLLIDAEEVARRRGDPSLCDSLTEDGKPYPSQQMLEVLTTIDNEGYEPL